MFARTTCRRPAYHKAREGCEAADGLDFLARDVLRNRRGNALCVESLSAYAVTGTAGSARFCGNSRGRASTRNASRCPGSAGGVDGQRACCGNLARGRNTRWQPGSGVRRVLPNASDLSVLPPDGDRADFCAWAVINGRNFRFVEFFCGACRKNDCNLSGNHV